MRRAGNSSQIDTVDTSAFVEGVSNARGSVMKVHRRKFLHLATGAAVFAGGKGGDLSVAAGARSRRLCARRRDRHHRAPDRPVGTPAESCAVAFVFALSSVRNAEMASRSLRRGPRAATPSSFRSSAVKFGRTLSSTSLSRNAASYFPRPKLRSQATTSMALPPLAHHCNSFHTG